MLKFTPPLPHNEAAETASFRKVFASAMQKVEPVCSPPAAKTEFADSLAAPVDSGQAGGTSSVYTTFFQNRDSFVQEIRLIYASQAEIDLLRALHKLSLGSWFVCDYALRSQIRDRVKSLAQFGLLLFLVD